MVIRRRSAWFVLCTLVWMAVLTTESATAQPADMFGENMVLQRDAKVPVWGWGEPGEEITVSFAGQTKRTNADRFGRWRVELDPMPASAEGRTMDITSSASKVQIPSVYVGDVWLHLSESWHLNDRAEYRSAEPHSDDMAPICLAAPAGVWEHQNHALRPVEGRGTESRWSVYKTPGKYFRNDAYYLGLGLTRATGAPVGIMGAGASTLESMTPPEGFAAFEQQLGPLAKEVGTWVPHTPRGKQAYRNRLAAIDDWANKTRPLLHDDDITFADLRQPPSLPGPPRGERGPTTLYNFVAHRFTPAAVRGIILQPKTYNLGDPQYEVKAMALIRGLRAACGRDDLPVCFVQMHTPDRYEQNETEDPADWVRMRAAQNRLARLPNTTVLATYDLKASSRSDPDPGLRVARWAAALVDDAPVKTGPVYKRHRVDGPSVIVEFDQIGRGLMIGKIEPAKPVVAAPDAPLGGFQIAGSDGQWHDATAIIRGETVVVTCDAVEKPGSVRYAWVAVPAAANLYNRAGFAALPFTSRR